MCQVEKSGVLKQTVYQKFTNHMEALDETTIESKASYDFHEVLFTSNWIEILQFFNLNFRWTR